MANVAWWTKFRTLLRFRIHGIDCYNASMQKSEILSYDEYARIEKVGFPEPYIVEIGKDGHCLLFYGSEHTKDPSHPQFQDIEHRWQSFMSQSSNPIALVEGHADEIPIEQTADKVQSITSGGESGFTVHLARRDGVPVISPEPNRVKEADMLADEFGRDNVLLYYYVRQLGAWAADTNKPDIEAKSKKMLVGMEKAFGWEDVDFSINGVHELYEKAFQKPLAITGLPRLYELTTPMTLDYVTNKLARRSGEIRDTHLLGKIKEYWTHKRSPFVVFGSSHAIRLEPAIRKLGY